MTGIPSVVIVIDGGAIDYRVGGVHPRKVTLTRLVRRIIRLTRAQGKPSNCRCRANREAQVETGAPSPSTNPRHQRGRVDRSHAIGSRYPAPPAVKGSPASIVVGRESPRSIVHPSPTPRGNPGPMPVMIGRPACRDCSRHPDLAIAGLIPPVAVLIEVVVAGDFARNVTCGLGSVLAEVTRRAPSVKVVASTDGRDIVVNLIVAPHHRLLPRVNRERLAAAGHLAPSIPDRDNGGPRIRVRVDAVLARPAYGESKVGCVDLKNLALCEIAKTDRQRPFRQTDLNGPIVQI